MSVSTDLTDVTLVSENTDDLNNPDEEDEGQTTSKDWATQLLIREQLSFAIIVKHFLLSGPRLPGV